MQLKAPARPTQTYEAMFAAVAAVLGLALARDVGAALAWAAVGYTFTWYIRSLGRSMAIIETAALIAVSQWLLGPLLAYQFGLEAGKYRMYVGEGAYFAYATPAVVLMLVGLRWSAPILHVQALRSFLVEHYSGHVRLAYSLILLGVAATFFANESSFSIGFVMYLLAQLKFVGAIYLVIYRARWRWAIAAAVFFVELSASAEAAMFHTLLLWGALMLSLVCLDLKLGAWAKLGLILVLVVAMSSLQGVKGSYREMIRQDPANANVTRLLEMIAAKPLGSANMSELNSRLNEGWIVSAVMLHVPAYAPFQGGRTVVNAVIDSIVPRALVAKAVVDQSESFRLYTGLPVGRGTSFGISVLGEAWVNFGWWGCLFMGGMGVVYGLFLKGLVWLSRTEPTMILWAPLLFLQAVKAETELVVVLNHLTKSLVFILVFYFVLTRLSASKSRTTGKQLTHLLRRA